MAFLKVQNLLIDDKKKIRHTSLPEFVFKEEATEKQTIQENLTFFHQASRN